MEAATPLHKPIVAVNGDQLHLDGLTVVDETAARLVRERSEAGEEPSEVVVNAIEIGARVLDREQAGANADFLRAEMAKATREAEDSLEARTRELSDSFGETIELAFGPDSGHVTKALERHFSDGSSEAVQHKVREVVAEAMRGANTELKRHLSSADGDNPLADFKSGTVEAVKQASERQDKALGALVEKLGAVELELQGLRDEREKQQELDAERERGTAKGRTFEEAVAAAVDALASARGDGCEPVGDAKGATGKTGDVLVSVDAAAGPARGRIVFEAKNRKLSRNDAMRELDDALAERDADFAVLVLPTEDKLPARTHSLREYNGDKLIVALDDDGGPQIALDVAYSLARARVLMARSEGEGVDGAAVRERVERALTAMDDVRRIKSQLTGATTSIEGARDILEGMAATVRGYLAEVDQMVLAADD